MSATVEEQLAAYAYAYGMLTATVEFAIDRTGDQAVATQMQTSLDRARATVEAVKR